MLWNDRFLFLHVPKTAGTSLNRALIAAWDRPIWGIVSRGTYREQMDADPKNLHLTLGSGHESLPLARRVLSQHDRRLSDFEAIFVVIRNPYDIMVSTYHFMQKSYPGDPDNPKYRFAKERDFATFANRVPMTDVGQWVSINGERPPNLRILRFEMLSEEFELCRKKYGFNDVSLPRLNVSKHKKFEDYMTPKIKADIYGKLPYLFDEEYYDR